MTIVVSATQTDLDCRGYALPPSLREVSADQADGGSVVLKIGHSPSQKSKISDSPLIEGAEGRHYEIQ